MCLAWKGTAFRVEVLWSSQCSNELQRTETPLLSWLSFKVSHVFKRYGPGVRFVHFLQKTKDVETPAGYLRTRATDSSVSVQLWD